MFFIKDIKPILSKYDLEHLPEHTICLNQQGKREVLTTKFSDRCCPDQYMGRIDTICKPDGDSNFLRWSFAYKGDLFQKSPIPSNVPILLILLESPHKLEFNWTGTEPGTVIGPANGVTGRNLIQYMHSIFGYQIQTYHLILVNAIQYQCSLGIAPKKYRDLIFSSLWNLQDKRKYFPYQENLQNRLNSIVNLAEQKKSELTIVNSCTQGENSIALRELIDIFLKKRFPDYYKYQTAHPSSWYSRKNRYLKEI